MTRIIIDPETCRAYKAESCPPEVLARHEAREAQRVLLAQVKFTETTGVTIICKNCGSDDVTRYGFKEGVQQYWCNKCKRKFVANNALPKMRYPPEQIAAAVNMFYEGLSLSGIRRQLDHDHNVLPSDATVYDWIVCFTKKGAQVLDGLKVDAGRTWVVDETVLQLDGENAWFWDIIVDETRFLIASHLTFTRTTRDAMAVLLRGKRASEHPPRDIISDGLRSYPDAVEQVFGADSRHLISKGFRNSLNTNLIERFHGTLKQRVKVMRGMQNRETARLVMDGWLLHYNFFRPHESLGGRTPAQAANVEFPWRTWRDVVIEGYIPTEKRETYQSPNP